MTKTTFLCFFTDTQKELKRTAGAEGFEPPDDGIKTRCLTTWRHPNTIENINNFYKNQEYTYIKKVNKMLLILNIQFFYF